METRPRSQRPMDSAFAKPPLRLTPNSILDRFMDSPTSTASLTPELVSSRSSPRKLERAMPGPPLARAVSGRLPPAGSSKLTSLRPTSSGCISRPWWQQTGSDSAEALQEAPWLHNQQASHDLPALPRQSSLHALPHHAMPAEADCFSPNAPQLLPQSHHRRNATTSSIGPFNSRTADACKATRDEFSSIMNRLNGVGKPVAVAGQPPQQPSTSRWLPFGLYAATVQVGLS